jgi:ribonuclease VapC
LIVVDSSALIAIALKEPEAEGCFDALRRGGQAAIAPINYVETGVILVRRGFVPSHHDFDEWLAELAIAVDEEANLGSDALKAYLRFGKGLHPARLNLADCFAYALAKTLDLPLLYKGDDFAKTDIRSALQPT